jgi:outer membrane protein TolC
VAATGLATVTWSALDCVARATARAREADVASAAADRGRAQADARRELAQALLTLTASRTRMATAQRAIAGADLTAASAWERYKEGLGSLLEVLEADGARLEVRESLIDAQRDARSTCVRFAMLTDPGGVASKRYRQHTQP